VQIAVPLSGLIANSFAFGPLAPTLTTAAYSQVRGGETTTLGPLEASAGEKGPSRSSPWNAFAHVSVLKAASRVSAHRATATINSRRGRHHQEINFPLSPCRARAQLNWPKTEISPSVSTAFNRWQASNFARGQRLP